MNERLRELRKSLGLSQAEFGDRIGIQKSSVSKLEVGENNPSDQTLMLIAREFHVSEHWLRTGEGEMFDTSNQTIVDELAAAYHLSDVGRAVIETFLSLSPEYQEGVMQYLVQFADRVRGAGLTVQNVSSRADDAEAKRIAMDLDETAEDVFEEIVRKYKPAPPSDEGSAG